MLVTHKSGLLTTNCHAEPKTQGKERNDDSHRVVPEKIRCKGNEEMSNNIEINQKFPHPGLKSKPRKIDALYYAAICVLLLTCSSPVQGAALRNTSMSLCKSYASNLSDSSGPWSGSTCSSELEKIQCPKDDECILITQIRGSNKKVAQCYEGKEYCPPPVATNPPTKHPLTPNATNPLPSSPNKSTGPLNGFNWTAVFTFLFCCWFIAYVCLGIVILHVDRRWICIRSCKMLIKSSRLRYQFKFKPPSEINNSNRPE